MSTTSSACSVAVSYKPPMLVTRARLPACALALATPPRFAVVHMQHVPVGSSVVTSLGGEVTKHVVITEPAASSRSSTSSAGARYARCLWCRVRAALPVPMQCAFSLGSTVVGSSGSKASNHVIAVGYSASARSMTGSACSVAVSYKPPMLVTQVRLPAYACR